MPEFYRFATVGGSGVAVQIGEVLMAWEGKQPNCTVLIVAGAENPVEIIAEFEDICDYLDVYDGRGTKR